MSKKKKILLKSPQKKSALYALHVTDDDKKSNFLSQAVLEYAGKVASSADTKLIPIARYDMNITSGIIHTMKEKNITEVAMSCGFHSISSFLRIFKLQKGCTPTEFRRIHNTTNTSITLPASD